MISSIVPTCIYFIDSSAAARHFRDDDNDDNDEGPPERRHGPFLVINDCLKYWFILYKVFDLVAALDLVVRASGLCGKALLAIDLFVKIILILVAKVFFPLSVRLFVGAALEGFPYLNDFFICLDVRTTCRL